MKTILEKLKNGDRRSIGKANEVVADVLKTPSMFGEVFDGMLNEDAIIRMRAADVVEKISAKFPEYLRPYKSRLIGQVARINQQEVRWHVAQMFSRLRLSVKERATVLEILFEYLNDESRIVKTFSMQALADLAERDSSLRLRILKLLEELTRTGSPAIKARGRKLLQRLKRMAEK
jgi:hypothetical protein